MNFSTLFFIASVFAQNTINDNVSQQCTSICKSLGANSPADLKDCSAECFDVVGKMASVGTPQPAMTSSQVSMATPSSVSNMDVIVVSKSEMSSNTMVSMASSASMSISSKISASASVLASASASSMMKSSQASLSAKSGPTEAAKPLGSVSKSSSSKSKGSDSDSSNAYFAVHSITFLAMAAFVSYL